MVRDRDDGALAVARALVDEAQAAFDAGSDGDVIAVADRVAELCGGDDDPAVRERVAYALLLKGVSLGKLGRREEEIGVYELLIARYGGSADPMIRRHVAWADNNRAFALKALDQLERALAAYDELIARFGDAGESEIRLRVDWALWNKADLLKQLSREREIDAVYQQLIGRRDDGLDGELDSKVAWCARVRAWDLGAEGGVGGQLRLWDEIAERFGHSSNVWVRDQVLAALREKAEALRRAGRSEDALETLEELLERFAGAPETELVGGLARALISKGALLQELGRSGEALAAQDRALSLLAGATDPSLLDLSVAALENKRAVLRAMNRLEETIVMCDSTVAAYRAMRAAGGDVLYTMKSAVVALFAKTELLCDLDRSEEAQWVVDELASVLGDAGASTDGDDSSAPAVTESELAAVFADIINSGECWRWFEAIDTAPPPTHMARRAIELYRLTQPWTLADEADGEDPAQAAAGMVRDIADGYAMLARTLTSEQRSTQPLPERAMSQRVQLIRAFGVDEWAAGLGYQLDLPQPPEGTGDTEPDQPASAPRANTAGQPVDAFVRFSLSSLYRYDLLTAAADSAVARDVLRDSFKETAAYGIAQGRRWARRAMTIDPDAYGIAIANLLIAQGFFLACHGVTTSKAAVCPSMTGLRDLLRDNGSSAWLRNQEATLPRRLDEEND